MNKIEELRKQLELEDRILTVVDNHDSLVEWVKGEKPEHCILPEHYSELANDLSVFVTSLLDNWISVKKFKLDIDKEWRDVLQADYSLDYENGIQEGFRLAKIIFKDLVPQPPKQSTKKRGGCNP